MMLPSKSCYPFLSIDSSKHFGSISASSLDQSDSDTVSFNSSQCPSFDFDQILASIPDSSQLSSFNVQNSFHYYSPQLGPIPPPTLVSSPTPTHVPILQSASSASALLSQHQSHNQQLLLPLSSNPQPPLLTSTSSNPSFPKLIIATSPLQPNSASVKSSTTTSSSATVITTPPTISPVTAAGAATTTATTTDTATAAATPDVNITCTEKKYYTPGSALQRSVSATSVNSSAVPPQPKIQFTQPLDKPCLQISPESPPSGLHRRLAYFNLRLPSKSSYKLRRYPNQSRGRDTTTSCHLHPISPSALHQELLTKPLSAGGGSNEYANWPLTLSTPVKSRYSRRPIFWFLPRSSSPTRNSRIPQPLKSTAACAGQAVSFASHHPPFGYGISAGHKKSLSLPSRGQKFTYTWTSPPRTSHSYSHSQIPRPVTRACSNQAYNVVSVSGATNLDSAEESNNVSKKATLSSGETEVKSDSGLVKEAAVTDADTTKNASAGRTTLQHTQLSITVPQCETGRDISCPVPRSSTISASSSATCNTLSHSTPLCATSTVSTDASSQSALSMRVAPDAASGMPTTIAMNVLSEPESQMKQGKVTVEEESLVTAEGKLNCDQHQQAEEITEMGGKESKERDSASGKFKGKKQRKKKKVGEGDSIVSPVLSNYLKSFTGDISNRAAASQATDINGPEDPASRNKLRALITSVVAAAHSSSPALKTIPKDTLRYKLLAVTDEEEEFLEIIRGKRDGPLGRRTAANLQQFFDELTLGKPGDSNDCDKLDSDKDNGGRIPSLSAVMVKRRDIKSDSESTAEIKSGLPAGKRPVQPSLSMPATPCVTKSSSLSGKSLYRHSMKVSPSSIPGVKVARSKLSRPVSIGHAPSIFKFSSSQCQSTPNTARSMDNSSGGHENSRISTNSEDNNAEKKLTVVIPSRSSSRPFKRRTVNIFSIVPTSSRLSQSGGVASPGLMNDWQNPLDSLNSLHPGGNVGGEMPNDHVQLTTNEVDNCQDVESHLAKELKEGSAEEVNDECLPKIGVAGITLTTPPVLQNQAVQNTNPGEDMNRDSTKHDSVLSRDVLVKPPSCQLGGSNTLPQPLDEMMNRAKEDGLSVANGMEKSPVIANSLENCERESGSSMHQSHQTQVNELQQKHAKPVDKICQGGEPMEKCRRLETSNSRDPLVIPCTDGVMGGLERSLSERIKSTTLDRWGGGSQFPLSLAETENGTKFTRDGPLSVSPTSESRYRENMIVCSARGQGGVRIPAENSLTQRCESKRIVLPSVSALGAQRRSNRRRESILLVSSRSAEFNRRRSLKRATRSQSVGIPVNFTRKAPRPRVVGELREFQSTILTHVTKTAEAIPPTSSRGSSAEHDKLAVSPSPSLSESSISCSSLHTTFSQLPPEPSPLGNGAGNTNNESTKLVQQENHDQPSKAAASLGNLNSSSLTMNNSPEPLTIADDCKMEMSQIDSPALPELMPTSGNSNGCSMSSLQSGNEPTVKAEIKGLENFADPATSPLSIESPSSVSQSIKPATRPSGSSSSVSSSSRAHTVSLFPTIRPIHVPKTMLPPDLTIRSPPSSRPGNSVTPTSFMANSCPCLANPGPETGQFANSCCGKPVTLPSQIPTLSHLKTLSVMIPMSYTNSVTSPLSSASSGNCSSFKFPTSQSPSLPLSPAGSPSKIRSKHKYSNFYNYRSPKASGPLKGRSFKLTRRPESESFSNSTLSPNTNPLNQPLPPVPPQNHSESGDTSKSDPTPLVHEPIEQSLDNKDPPQTFSSTPANPIQRVLNNVKSSHSNRIIRLFPSTGNISSNSNPLNPSLLSPPSASFGSSTPSSDVKNSAKPSTRSRVLRKSRRPHSSFTDHFSRTRVA